MALSVAINGTYFCLTRYDKRPADSLFLQTLAVESIWYYSVAINTLHRVSTTVSSAKAVLLPSLLHLKGTQALEVMRLRKVMLCTRDVAITEGRFQRIPRMAVANVVDFFLQRVISLLVASKY